MRKMILTIALAVAPAILGAQQPVQQPAQAPAAAATDTSKAKRPSHRAARSAPEPVGVDGRSAALAAAYGGDLTTARTLLDQARSMATCASHRAFVAYVEGELLATTQPAASIPCYEEAIAEASGVGCNFVDGVARVALASARMRIGDVTGAAEGFSHLIEFWRRTGHPGSAYFYYGIVRNRYPGTKYFDMATERMHELRGAAAQEQSVPPPGAPRQLPDDLKRGAPLMHSDGGPGAEPRRLPDLGQR